MEAFIPSSKVSIDETMTIQAFVPNAGLTINETVSTVAGNWFLLQMKNQLAYPNNY